MANPARLPATPVSGLVAGLDGGAGQGGLAAGLESGFAAKATGTGGWGNGVSKPRSLREAGVVAGFAIPMSSSSNSLSDNGSLKVPDPDA